MIKYNPSRTYQCISNSTKAQFLLRLHKENLQKSTRSYPQTLQRNGSCFRTIIVGGNPSYGFLFSLVKICLWIRSEENIALERYLTSGMNGRMTKPDRKKAPKVWWSMRSLPEAFAICQTPSARAWQHALAVTSYPIERPRTWLQLRTRPGPGLLELLARAPTNQSRSKKFSNRWMDRPSCPFSPWGALLERNNTSPNVDYR